VVQYEAYIENEWHPVVRYDTAHGFLHKDVLHADGTSDKRKLAAMNSAEAFTQCELDIKLNWESYRNRYEEEMRK